MIQGVAFTMPKYEYLETSVRIQGTLPLKGIWCLKTLKVDNTDGSKLQLQQPMAGATDVPDTGGYGPLGFSPLKSGGIPNRLRLEGELVHYRSIDETASFPTIKLHPIGPGRKEGPAMRDWFVKDGEPATATTARGLILRIAKLGGYGYSGPGYNNLSRIPVRVDLSSLNAGLAPELRSCNERTVDRVDAYVQPELEVCLYREVPKIEMGTFSYRDQDFSPEVQLSLHVVRRIVDRRIKFTFVLPVQRDKDMDEQHKAVPDPAQFLEWPGSTKLP